MIQARVLLGTLLACALGAMLVGCVAATADPSAQRDSPTCEDTCEDLAAVCGEVCGEVCGQCGSSEICNDGQCESACGNAVVDDGELCDGDCPETCDDHNPCTRDLLSGSSGSCDAQCSNLPIETCSDEDGCCPALCNQTSDIDCSSVCGNDVVEEGEVCDGDCPVSCTPTNRCSEAHLEGSASSCDSVCIQESIVACMSGDGCCADGCDGNTDSDCEPICGNGVAEQGELCDGDCPAACEPVGVCSQVTMVGSSEACSAQCVSSEITECSALDGCCPAGCDFTSDWDCPAPLPDTTPLFEDSRPVEITLPLQYTPSQSWPVVVLLHGYMNRVYPNSYTDARVWVDEYFQVSNQVDADGFILLQPSANLDIWDKVYWNATDWCCDFNDENPDDVGYLRSVVEAAKERFHVDENRVYFMGHSNGGFMSYRMACDAADIVAGIMAFAGTTFTDDANCEDTGDVTILHVHGDADEVIFYDGDTGYPGALETVERWAQRNGCADDWSTHDPIDLVWHLDGMETVVRGLDHCSEDTSVYLWSITGGTHSRFYCSWGGSCLAGTVFRPSFMPQVLDFLLSRPKRDLTLCGNGQLDGGESCDGDCPTTCDDGVACTLDTLVGSATLCSARCQHRAIEGCCETTADCPSDAAYSCDDGVCEPL